ncbi:MAG: response regulator [Thiohalocapsa sp.]|jgi:two-component system sensor histidine kinase RpfC|uniref:ATP-binding protein n=1 Tax=Thiohalocapsa sp. TaxID=2497641 RepID=UPI0025F7126E|nr:ATP-binding protein [Thiohalocapsa sp.]MCG6942718.1 response regulator [Thiohalocapsa sp.]
MFPVSRIPSGLRGNPEFQSAVVRIGIWAFGLVYIGTATLIGMFHVNYLAFVTLFAGYLVLNVAILFSVLVRAQWNARRYTSQFFDILAVSLAIYLTGDPGSPFYLIYIWIFISAGTRYGRTHLAVAASAAVASYNIVLAVLGSWASDPMDAAFHVLVLVLLPLYQDSLLVKLREARRAAEQANQAKSDFLANMTHELRTPLTGVLGMANLLRTTELDTQQREYLNAITSSANTLQALIGDILDLSKIDAKKLQLEQNPFDLRDPVREVCDVLHAHALAKGLDLVCDVTPDLPLRVVGDALRVRQILFNLIGNAVKFTECGQVVVRTKVDEAAPDDSRIGVALEVEDTGIGIAPDKLESIFESFRQADDSTTRRYGGTGLGTTIARDLIRIMDGRIGVESELGRGTRFRVWLPLLGRDYPITPAPPQPHFDGVRVLIYEGNAVQRDIIHATCRALGMRCFAENDIGRLGTVIRRAGGIDLLIIGDSPEPIDLPALLTTFRRLLHAQVPYLLLIYGQRRGELREYCRHCLTKPFLREELMDALNRILARGDARSYEDTTAAAPAPPAPAPPPRSPAAVTTKAAPAPRAEAEPDANAPRVLVAEDNAIAATVIRTLLAQQGAAVTLVSDGEAALEAARRADFHLAFVDLRMPKIDGIDFTRRVRTMEQGSRRLPIIALTANAAEDVRDRCLEAGMDAFLTKPVNTEALKAMVAKYTPKPAA